jgi:hypothetical protein
LEVIEPGIFWRSVYFLIILPQIRNGVICACRIRDREIESRQDKGRHSKSRFLPTNFRFLSRPDPSGDELVRHFLIEPTSKGVKLKGYTNEPVFGSLSALVYQVSIFRPFRPKKVLPKALFLSQ